MRSRHFHSPTFLTWEGHRQALTKDKELELNPDDPFSIRKVGGQAKGKELELNPSRASQVPDLVEIEWGTGAVLELNPQYPFKKCAGELNSLRFFRNKRWGTGEG